MKKLAVHLHLYYLEYLPKILQYLENLKGVEYDLFITMNERNAAIETRLKEQYPSAKIWQVENRGYDIGPFIDFLHQINLNDYEYVLKLHTKGKKSKNYTWLNGHRLDNALWGRVLWDGMLKNKERLQNNLKFLDEHSQYGMLGSKYCETDAKQDYEKLLSQINAEMSKLHQSAINELSFIAGSMFLVRAECLKPLQTYQIADFETTDGEVKEGTLAHIVERVFGALVTGQNYKIKTIKHDGYGIYFMMVALKRFLFQQKITNSGKKLIKICKLPVYSKPLRG